MGSEVCSPLLSPTYRFCNPELVFKPSEPIFPPVWVNDTNLPGFVVVFIFGLTYQAECLAYSRHSINRSALISLKGRQGSLGFLVQEAIGGVADTVY